MSHPPTRASPEHQNSQAIPGFSGFCPSVTPLHPSSWLAGCDSVTVPGTPRGSLPLGAAHPGDHCTQGITAPWPAWPAPPPRLGEGGPATGRSRWRRHHEHFYFFAVAHKNMFSPGSCQNAIHPVRCTALWTQIDLNP